MRSSFVYVSRSALFAIGLLSGIATACGGAEGVHCSSDAECSSRGLVCDVGQGLCVECTRDGDCLGLDEICVGAGVCRSAPSCVSSRECAGQVCELALMRCVDCAADTDCPSDQRCERYSCVPRPPACASDGECASLGLVCDEPANECVQCTEASDCISGFSCVDRRCTNESADGGRDDGGVDRDAGPPADSGPPIDAGPLPDSGPPVDGGPLPDGGGADAGGSDAGGADAGPCAVGCPPRANSNVTCAGGDCIYTCIDPFADCDDNPGNGCEVDTDSDAQHCSRCEMVCSAPFSTASCDGGDCELECIDGRGDCDGSAGNGCEVDLETDPQHCDQCNRSCPDRPRSSPVCDGGDCDYECDESFRDCDGAPGNGCETDIRTDARHCGGCNNPCPARMNAAPVCDGGCGYECLPGFFDCDTEAFNGCESEAPCPGGMCSSEQQQCTRPGACQCVGCNTDGTCSADDDDCVCPDCRGDAGCDTCTDDGVCDVYLEGCVCADCATLPICTTTGGGN